MKWRCLFVTLPAAAVFLGIAILAYLKYGEASKANAETEAFNQRLIQLQHELIKNQSAEVDQFISEATKAGYAPAYYLRALQSSNQKTQEQAFSDMSFALQHGVVNAALLIPGGNVDFVSDKTHASELRRKALEIIGRVSQQKNFYTMIAKMRLIHEEKTQTGEDWDPAFYKKLLFPEMKQMQSSGSPLTILLVLEILEGDDKFSRERCQVLAVSMPLQNAKSCKTLQDLDKTTIDVERVTIGLESYKHETERQFGPQLDFYRKLVCGKLAVAYADGPICTDMLSFIFSVCSLRLDYPNLATVNGVMVCRENEIDDAIRGIAEEIRPLFVNSVFELK